MMVSQAPKAPSHETFTPTIDQPRRYHYRPGLDGIRAIAVIAVLLYHGDVSWLQGGFLGVDLFFVLSGYLITTLLLSEFHSSETIALGQFWLRRLRRLGPALVVVLLAAALYAIFLSSGTSAEAEIAGIVRTG